MAALKKNPKHTNPKTNQNAPYLVIRLFLAKDHAKGHSSLTQRLFKHHLIHERWELQTGTNSKKWTFSISCYLLAHWWQYISSESSGEFGFSFSGREKELLVWFLLLFSIYQLISLCKINVWNSGQMFFSLLEQFFIGFHTYLEVDLYFLKNNLYPHIY